MPKKLKMVEKNGDMVPFYAADGVGRMKYGGRVKMMGGGAVRGYMNGGKITRYKYGGKVKKGYNYGGCVMAGRGGSFKDSN